MSQMPVEGIAAILEASGVEITHAEPAGTPAILCACVHDDRGDFSLHGTVTELQINHDENTFRIIFREIRSVLLTFTPDAQRPQQYLRGTLDGEYAHINVTATFMTIPALLDEPDI